MRNKKIAIIAAFALLFVPALTLGGQSSTCPDKPNFTVINVPPFAIDGEGDEVSSELRFLDDRGVPDMRAVPLDSRLIAFFGNLLEEQEISRMFRNGVMHRSCIEAIDVERSVLKTWTVIPTVLLTRVDSTEVVALDQDTVVVLAAKEKLMARLRLLASDGSVVEEKYVWPEFGTTQAIHLAEKFETPLESEPYRLLVVTPVEYPVSVRLRLLRETLERGRR